jgi:type II secretory pathway component GspD/PulD (secretin)
VLVIGGLRQRNDTGDFNGLPYLKDLRFLHLGALFRGRETEIDTADVKGTTYSCFVNSHTARSG